MRPVVGGRSPRLVTRLARRVRGVDSDVFCSLCTVSGSRPESRLPPFPASLSGPAVRGASLPSSVPPRCFPVGYLVSRRVSSVPLSSLPLYRPCSQLLSWLSSRSLSSCSSVSVPPSLEWCARESTAKIRRQGLFSQLSSRLTSSGGSRPSPCSFPSLLSPHLSSARSGVPRRGTSASYRLQRSCDMCGSHDLLSVAGSAAPSCLPFAGPSPSCSPSFTRGASSFSSSPSASALSMPASFLAWSEPRRSKTVPTTSPPASPCPSAPRRLHASSVFTLPFLRLSSRLLSNHEARGGAQDDAAGEGRQGEQSCTLRVTREQFHDGSRGLFRPHPFNRRFARVRKPVFPIEARNLRLMYKRKPKRRRGRGDKSNAKGIRWKHVHQQAGRYKGPRSRTFEGGKNPLYKRIPKWPDAWLARQRRVLEPLNLAKIRTFIESGRLDTRFTITQRHLHDSRCVKVKNGVKLFNVNDYPFPYKISIEVAGADQSSIDAIRRVGGEVIIVYRNRLNLRAHIKPYKFEVLPRTARPNLEMLHYLEKMRARGCVVKYVKPQWLIDEERSLKTELAEFEAEALIAKGEAVDRSAPDLRESVDDLQERLLKRFRLRETLAAELTRQQEAEEAERKAKQNDGERAD